MTPWFRLRHKPIQFSLFFKILVGYLVLLSISLVLINTVIRFQYQKYVEAKTIANNAKVVSFISETLDKYILRIDAGVSALTDSSQLFYDIQPEQTVYEKLKAQLDSEMYVSKNFILKDLQSDVSSILVYMDDAHYLRVGGGEIRRDLQISDMAWYRDFTSRPGPSRVIGPQQPFYDEITRQLKGAGSGPAIYYIRKVTFADARKNPESVPVVIVSLRFSGFDKLFTPFLGSKRSGYCILDGEGTLLYQSATVSLDLAGQFDRLARPGETAPLSVTLHQAAGDMLLTSNYVRSLDWRIIYFDYLDDLLADIQPVLASVNTVIVLASVLSLLAAILLSYRIVVPVRRLNQLMKSVSAGDFTVRSAVTSQDEIGQLSNRFNTMLTKIQLLIDEKYVAELNQQEARWEAMQAQINPHFLYNTLENIDGIAQVEHVPLISSLTQSLSKLFRYSVSTTSRFARLSEELEHAGHYLTIMNIRLDQRIIYETAIATGLEHCLVMRLLLQPLVENAVTHGLPANGRDPLMIRLQAAVNDQGLLVIKVSNNGLPIEKRQLAVIQGVLQLDPAALAEYRPRGSGIGLRNVSERLRLLYHGQASLQISQSPELWTEVEIALPLQLSEQRVSGGQA